MKDNTVISNSELAILALLAESPKHGYQIELDIQSRGMREWTDIAFSSIYHLLNKLEAYGWLESSKQESRDRPTRKVYRMSAGGYSIYTQAVISRLREPRHNSGDFPMALANLGCLEPTEITAALQSNLASLQNQLTHVHAKQNADHQTTPGLPWFVSMLFEYSEKQISTQIEFISELLDRMNGPFSPGG